MDISNEAPFIFIHIFELFSIIIILFLCLFIALIIKKTPASMKNYKIYLIIYATYALLLEISLALYSPRILHPYVFFYPDGIASLLPPPASMAILAFSLYCMMALLDCCIAMILERYFSMAVLSTSTSQIPFRIFMALSGISGCYLICILGIIFIPALNLKFFGEYGIQHIYDYFKDDSEIAKELRQSLQNSRQNNLPIGVTVVLVLFGLRFLIAVIMLLLNVRISHKLKPRISTHLQSVNNIQLNITYIQFFGFVSLLAFPLIINVAVLLFVVEPSNIPNICLAVMTLFGLYDPIVTVIYVKSYRRCLCQLFLTLFHLN